MSDVDRLEKFYALVLVNSSKWYLGRIKAAFDLLNIKTYSQIEELPKGEIALLPNIGRKFVPVILAAIGEMAA